MSTDLFILNLFDFMDFALQTSPFTGIGTFEQPPWVDTKPTQQIENFWSMPKRKIPKPTATPSAARKRRREIRTVQRGREIILRKGENFPVTMKMKAKKICYPNKSTLASNRSRDQGRFAESDDDPWVPVSKLLTATSEVSKHETFTVNIE